MDYYMYLYPSQGHLTVSDRIKMSNYLLAMQYYNTLCVKCFKTLLSILLFAVICFICAKQNTLGVKEV